MPTKESTTGQCFSIGVDLGGSHITCILIDAGGLSYVSSSDKIASDHTSLKIISKLNIEVVDRSVDSIIKCIIKIVTAILNDSDIKPVFENSGYDTNQTRKCIGIGIGIPGNVDPTTGTTRYLPNFGWVTPVPLRQLIQDDLDELGYRNIPINMRNDGRCAAIAESYFGIGKGARVFAMLTIGTGIGGALVINGNLFDGISYDAGDFGHHVICSGDDAFTCVCGKRGCFEFHASADGLVRHFHKIGGSSSVKNAMEVLIRVRDSCFEDHNIAIEALNCYKEDLSTGLANLVTFYNPDVIGLGGGLSQAQEIFHELVEMVDLKSLPASRGRCKVLPARLSIDAGAIGAAIIGTLGVC